MLLGDGDELHLNGGAPERERAGVVLYQDAEESLQTAQDCAVQHNGPMLLAVGPDVVHVEALRHLEVQLDGAALPGPADAVLQVKIDLGHVHIKNLRKKLPLKWIETVIGVGYRWREKANETEK